MKKTVGQVDKWIRIVLGIGLLIVLIVVQSGLRWLGLLGIVLLITGLTGYCPLYSLLNINTNKSGK